MACLHGMLMHGDDHDGDTHKAEDQYLRFQPVLRTGSPEKAGPQDAEQTFHASLMHNGDGMSGSFTSLLSGISGGSFTQVTPLL